jgi:5S rRNA maturation endonuclease (ribonuclease M5)
MKAEELEKLLASLQDAMDDGTPVIVEGVLDRKALQGLGLEGRVLTLSKTSFSVLAERLARSHRRVVVLTDFDGRGEAAARRLRELFLNEGVQCDLEYRRKLRALTGVKQFEELASLAGRVLEAGTKQGRAREYARRKK